MVICRHFSQNLDEIWQLSYLVLLSLCNFDFKHTGALIQIQESFNNTVCGVDNEALSEFLELVEIVCFALKILHVFTGCDLPFSLDSLVVFVVPHFVIVNVGIVFANFSQEDFTVFDGSGEEGLDCLENFFFGSFWELDVELAWLCYHEEFFVLVSFGLETDGGESDADDFVDFGVEAWDFVVDDLQVWVADPGVDEFFVKNTSFRDCFVASSVVHV